MQQVSREITKLRSRPLLRQDSSHQSWIWLGVVAAALVVGDGLDRTGHAQKREDLPKPTTLQQESPKAYVIRGYILETSSDRTEYTVIGEDEELWIIRNDDILERQEWQDALKDIPAQPVQWTLKPGAALKNIVFVPLPAASAEMCRCSMNCDYGFCCAKKYGAIWLKPRCGTLRCKVKLQLCPQ